MAVRFDANTDYLYRTANLPPVTGVTMLGWFCQVVSTGTNAALLSLNDSVLNENVDVEYAADGTTLSIYVYTAGNVNFASSPALGSIFCAAFTISGTSVVGYWRPLAGQRWITASATRGALTPTSWSIGQYQPNPAYGLNGRAWGVKVFDRVLTTEELTAEAFSSKVVNARSLNGFYPLPHAGDTFDYGPHGRVLTRTGTPTTEHTQNVFTLQPQRLWIIASPGSDVSVSLSGQAVTVSAGTLSVTHTQVLSGSAGTTAAGTLVAAPTIALVGQSSTTSAGTLATSRTQGLSGTSITTSSGTLVPTLGLILSGLALTSATGTVGVARANALTGGSVTTSAGVLTPATAAHLSGISITILQGTVTASIDSSISVALTGQAIGISAGALTPGTAKDLAGQSVTVSAGTLSPTTALVLLANLTTLSAGILTAALSKGLTGGSVTIAAGIIVPGLAISLSGGVITFSTGTVTAAGGSTVATITIKAGSWFRYRIVD